MRYNEIKKITESEIDPKDPDNGLIDPNEDHIRQANLTDTRKPNLTLRMINRLKKMRATKKLEYSKKQEFLGVMYGKPKDDEGI